MDKDNVTSGGGKEVNDLHVRRGRRARVIECYTMQKKEKESSVISRCNAMSRYNSYKLIKENIVIK